MIWSIFQTTPLKARLQRLLRQVEEERVDATANVAFWRAQEKFLISEAARLYREIDFIAEEQAADAAEAPEAAPAAEGSVEAVLPRIH